MDSNRQKKIRIFIVLLLVSLILTRFQIIKPGTHSASAAVTDTVCRFGITSPLGSEGYDISSIGVGSYLDWGAALNPNLPEGTEYIRVLRLRNDLYPQTLMNIAAWVEANIGSTWVIGNEPDTIYENQDALLPEIYAERYFELATIIRNLDATARIAFGSVVQPTPIRMRYLDRALNQLIADAGSPAAASDLIDIWSIHSFILNEQLHSWGTGIPPGFENDHDDAVVITNLDDTFSIDIFQSRIIAFRSWLDNKGERDKPLWITEYGSLMPPIDPPGGPDYYNVSDEDTANYMLATFDFMISATDSETGLPSDNNHLVQRWFWYSLNEHRYTFGGSLFDPDIGKVVTIVGENFIAYQSIDLAQPDLYPVDLMAAAMSYDPSRTLVNYRLYVTLGNSLLADTSSNAQVWIYDGDPEAGGVLIAGPIASDSIQRCGGKSTVTADWMAVQPLVYHTIYVQVEPVGVADFDPENNQASFTVFLDLPRLFYLTTIYR